MKKSLKKKMFTRGKDECDCGCHHSKMNSCGSGIYGLGFLGAAIYYISTATSFWMGALGLLKALVWPAFLVYSLLKSVGA